MSSATAPQARNIIVADEYCGIVIQSGAFAVSGNVIQGNYIGTDVTGNIALSLTSAGIALFNSVNNTVIGGTAPGQGMSFPATGLASLSRASIVVVLVLQPEMCSRAI